MPSFTYTGDNGRYYPTLGLSPIPGDNYDLDVAPDDGRWVAAKPTKPAPSAEEK